MRRHHHATRMSPWDEITTAADLDRIASHRTQRSTRSVAIDPDGGLHAWLKVFGCFLMYANTLYVTRSPIPMIIP